jgi:MOSC domain-containing protein YiiM
MNATLIAICTGTAAPLFIRDPHDEAQIHKEISGIQKVAVSTLQTPAAIACKTLGLAGDEQVDLTVHGGPNKAVYCYPTEHYEFWKKELPWLSEQDQQFGQVGENLCLKGLLEHELWVGDQLQIGESVVLRVIEPREPCYKFNARMRSNQAAKLMTKSGRFGWYCCVMKEGELRAGDTVTVIPGAREIKLLDC